MHQYLQVRKSSEMICCINSYFCFVCRAPQHVSRFIFSRRTVLYIADLSSRSQVAHMGADKIITTVLPTGKYNIGVGKLKKRTTIEFPGVIWRVPMLHSWMNLQNHCASAHNILPNTLWSVCAPRGVSTHIARFSKFYLNVGLLPPQGTVRRT